MKLFTLFIKKGDNVKIKKVVFPLNSSPMYSGMWDITAEVYTKTTDITPVLVFCGTQEELDAEVKSDYGEVVLLPKHDPVIVNPHRDWSVIWSTIWYIANKMTDEHVSLAGIDAFPLCDRLWRKFEEIDDHHYICGLGLPYKTRRRHIASGYNSGLGSTFKQVLDIDDDLTTELEKIWNMREMLFRYIPKNWHVNDCWGLDEARISERVFAEARPNVTIMDGKWVKHNLLNKRIDRSKKCAYDPKLFKWGYYWEVHMTRPLSEPWKLGRVEQILGEMGLR